MPRDTDALIAELVGDLEPVQPLRFSNGLGFALVGMGTAFLLVALLLGIRADVMAGSFNPVFLLATGLFLLLGLSAAVTVVMMGRPRVGSDHGGWVWAAAMAALLPLAAGITGLGRSGTNLSAMIAGDGSYCLLRGSLLSILTLVLLAGWLRRGAPTSPERAGLLAGIAAGSFGIFAFSFHCPNNDIIHIGVWHSLVVVVSAIVGRVAVPRFIRW